MKKKKTIKKIQIKAINLRNKIIVKIINYINMIKMMKIIIIVVKKIIIIINLI